jgi:class 3 adenylate cyclase/tetratricopeptide (TPR) repeat protein
VICTHCQRENPEDAAFCAGCGRPLALLCPACGRPNPSDASFCNGCGQRLRDAAPPASPERAPRDYTPKHLAEKILHGKSALEGERKQVTVLFADVKGSMDLSEQVDAEEWHRVLNRFFEILTDGVHRFEGTVNQYTGDGIMALFGAPITHEDHAQRACYAALHLRDELRSYADELRLDRGLSFAVRMGLNSGEVVVGKIGDDLRMDYTAQGHTVGLAARVEQLAEPGRAYVTQDTAQLIEGFFQLRDLGGAKVAGGSEPVHVYELEGTGAMRTRLDVSRARGFSRFVGRVDEMATLELALHRTVEGNGQIVGVVGEAGVGKSRLCLEFVERCRARDVPVLEAHCPAHGRTVPLLPILELLRNSFGITAHDRDQTAREKIAGRLVLLDRAFDEALPLVFDFLGVPDPERPAPQMDPDARQRRLFSLVRRMVQAGSEREPVVLLFDDIQWIDSGSDAFLTQIAGAVSGTRTLLLANFRPEYHADWMGKSNYQQLPLSPLGPRVIDELLHGLLGDDTTVLGLRDLICERTGGNPFFVEEVVQSLAESGSVVGGRGAYRLATSVEKIAIPSTVQAVLAARIDRLPEREKQVLQTAAVAAAMGKRFLESLLGRVVRLPGADLAAALSRLQSDEFLYEEGLYPDLEYAFKHPLTQEVAYDAQLSGRRAEVHASVARALEEIHADKLDEQAAALAHHWEQAGGDLEAARWHRRAAEWIVTTDAAEALRHARGTRRLVEDAAPGEDSVELELWASVEVVRQAWRVGISADECEATFERGCELARSRGDERSLAVLHVHRSWDKILSREDRAQAVEWGREGLAHARRSGDRGVQLVAASCLILVEWNVFGDCRVAETGRRALREEPDDLNLGFEHLGFSPYIFLLGFTGFVESCGGRPRVALVDMERAERLAREHGEFELECYCQYWLIGCVGDLLGDTERGLVCARRALEAAERTPSPMTRVYSNLTGAMAHYWASEFESAVSCAEQALEASQETGTGVLDQPEMLAVLAASRMALGELDEARKLSDRAVALADDRQHGVLRALTRRYRLQALLAAEGAATVEEIERVLTELEPWIEERGWGGLQPFASLGRAELARRRGDKTTRERERREAHRLFDDMGSTCHAERLAKELGL